MVLNSKIYQSATTKNRSTILIKFMSSPQPVNASASHNLEAALTEGELLYPPHFPN
jgi:hypothetical protein